MTAPRTFEIPAGTQARECRGCGKPIYFVRTAAGRRAPLNADGTSHFADCPQADRFRRPRKPNQ